MRQIKFRGKRTNNGAWVYGDFIHGVGMHYGNSYILPNEQWLPTDCDPLDGYLVDPETVDQFTGLFGYKPYHTPEMVDAKADQEAYYGDIIRFSNTEGRIFVKQLWWSEELQCTMVGNMPYYRLHESGYIQPSKLVFQIIGNIHDNPEILKGGGQEGR